MDKAKIEQGVRLIIEGIGDDVIATVVRATAQRLKRTLTNIDTPDSVTSRHDAAPPSLFRTGPLQRHCPPWTWPLAGLWPT